MFIRVPFYVLLVFIVCVLSFGFLVKLSLLVKLIIIIIRQFVRRNNMSVKSLQGRRTEYTTRIKLHNAETAENAETGES